MFMPNSPDCLEIAHLRCLTDKRRTTIKPITWKCVYVCVCGQFTPNLHEMDSARIKNLFFFKENVSSSHTEFQFWNPYTAHYTFAHTDSHSHPPRRQKSVQSIHGIIVNCVCCFLVYISPNSIDFKSNQIS